MGIQDKVEILNWQIEMGIDETMGEQPVNHFQQDNTVEERDTLKEPSEEKVKSPSSLLPAVDTPQETSNLNEAVDDATRLVSKVTSLEDLREALLEFHHCPYRKTSRNLVFSDGNPDAWLMIVGEAPGNEEDIKGKPFVGKSGRLLDKIFSEVSISRLNSKPQDSFYITNSINWRPPGNRNPTSPEIEMFRPFIWKHIELINPKILVLTGNIACSAILRKQGITKLRGTWSRIDEMDVMPTVHPAFLLRNPTFKKNIWQDVLAIKKKLGELDRNE